MSFPGVAVVATPGDRDSSAGDLAPLLRFGAFAAEFASVSLAVRAGRSVVSPLALPRDIRSGDGASVLALRDFVSILAMLGGAARDAAADPSARAVDVSDARRGVVVPGSAATGAEGDVAPSRFFSSARCATEDACALVDAATTARGVGVGTTGGGLVDSMM